MIMDIEFLIITNGVLDSTDRNPFRCKKCPYDFTDSDGYHQKCFEEEITIGGCVLMHPCGEKLETAIRESQVKKHILTLAFDFHAQAKTWLNAREPIKLTEAKEFYFGREHIDDTDYDPWTDPAYQMQKMCWQIHKETGLWMVIDVHGEEYSLYTVSTDSGARRLVAEVLNYHKQNKLHFFTPIRW
jgi:hypothetical protein